MAVILLCFKRSVWFEVIIILCGGGGGGGTSNTVENSMVKKVDCTACKICGFLLDVFDRLIQIGHSAA